MPFLTWFHVILLFAAHCRCRDEDRYPGVSHCKAKVICLGIAYALRVWPSVLWQNQSFPNKPYTAGALPDPAGIYIDNSTSPYHFGGGDLLIRVLGKGGCCRVK